MRAHRGTFAAMGTNMKTIALIILIVSACTRTVVVPASAVTAALPAPHNVAEDNAMHELPGATCERVWQFPQLQSARCVSKDGSIEVYCTASDTGYGCTILRAPQQKQQPDAGSGVGSGSAAPQVEVKKSTLTPGKKP